jgi:hypothetical protein
MYVVGKNGFWGRELGLTNYMPSVLYQDFHLSYSLYTLCDISFHLLLALPYLPYLGTRSSIMRTAS